MSEEHYMRRMHDAAHAAQSATPPDGNRLAILPHSSTDRLITHRERGEPSLVPGCRVK